MAGSSAVFIKQFPAVCSAAVAAFKKHPGLGCDNRVSLVPDVTISAFFSRQVNSSSVGYHVESSPEWTYPGANLSFKGLASILCRKIEAVARNFNQCFQIPKL